MSIFSYSSSEFRQRRRQAILNTTSTFFFASWYLLRMQSEEQLNSPVRVRYHWQQSRYRWRKQGTQRKPRKTYPKSPKQRQTKWGQAYRWHISAMPLT